MATEKKTVNYRLTPEAREVIRRLQALHACSASAVVEMAVRALGRRDLRGVAGQGEAGTAGRG